LIETARNLHRLRGLLLESPLPYHEALSVAKEMMLHGINDREVFYFQQAAILLLEQAFRPGLQGCVEQESMLKRLVTKIMRHPGLDPEEIVGEVSRMIASLPSSADSVPSTTMSLEDGDRMVKLLLRIPGFSRAVGEVHSEAQGWQRVHEMVDSCILEQGREQRRKEREWQRSRQPLVRLVETLIQAADRIHYPTDGFRKAVQVLDSQEVLTIKLPAFVENLLVEARGLKKAQDEAIENVQTADAAIAQLNDLFRKADTQLMHSRDQELIDLFTGLGNRFALTEHRKRHPAGDRQAMLFVFFDEDPDVYPKLVRAEVLRVLGFIGRRIQKLKIGLPFHIGEETIVVILSEDFCRGAASTPIKEHILDRIQATKGFPTHVRFGMATIVLTVASDEEVVLEKGKQLARSSASKAGQPLMLEMGQTDSDHSVPPSLR